MVPIAVLQLLVLPYMAARLGDVNNGLALTIIGLFALSAGTFGNSLNNVRLLMQLDYEEQRLQGDFNPLLILFTAVNCIVMVIGTCWYEGGFHAISILLVVSVSVLNLLREYFSVEFRLKLNYNAVLINNLFLVAGYLLGTVLFYQTGYWQFIYLIGTGLSLLYILKKTSLHREPLKKTPLYPVTARKSVILMISAFCANALNYLDRLLLFPMLGGTAVSIYYSATLFGKIISMGITPINNVMLSYFSRIKDLKRKYFFYLLGAVTAVGSIGYVICVLISKSALHLLYPTWAAQSLQYIAVTTATAIFQMISSVLNPMVLRFRKTEWRIIINLSNIILYVGLSLVLVQLYGLMGFCIAAMLTSLLKIFALIAIYMGTKHT